MAAAKMVWDGATMAADKMRAVEGLRLRVGAHAPRRHTCTSSEGRRQLYVPGGGACGESQRRGRRGGAACV